MHLDHLGFPSGGDQKAADSGWKVIFDDVRGYLPHKATAHTFDLVRDRGIFTIDALAEPSGTNSLPVFNRPE